MNIEGLVCPLTHQPLRVAKASELRSTTLRHDRNPFGVTETVLLRPDGAGYPVVDGVPVLLGPELIGTSEPADLDSPRYQEAYLEMAYYNEICFRESERLARSGIEAAESDGIRQLARLRDVTADQQASFPKPHELWLSTTVDAAAELDCYAHFAPLHGKRILNVGGKGTAAIRFLAAGASEALLVTPMIGEAQVALTCARLMGFEGRLRCVAGVGEEIPTVGDYFDGVFVGGCIHHMQTETAFAEISRVLRPGGKFAAIEPWRAPGYGIGTKIFGKREANFFCRPMDAERIAPLSRTFANCQCNMHGPLSRYLMIVAEKAGMRFTPHRALRVTQMDDRVASAVGARGLASGLAILATK